MPRDPEHFPEDDRTRLKHMLAAARKAVKFCASASRADLDTNDMLQLAVLKAIETVGEASSKVSDATRSSLPTIDWSAIRRMRNRLIHGYDTADNSIV